MSETVSETNRDAICCPKCGYLNTDLHEYEVEDDAIEVECGDGCGAKFKLTYYMSFYYRAKLIPKPKPCLDCGQPKYGMSFDSKGNVLQFCHLCRERRRE